MESNHAALKPITAAMKCIQIRHLKDDQVFGRAAVFESPVDEGMSHLCGSEADCKVCSSDGVEPLRPN